MAVYFKTSVNIKPKTIESILDIYKSMRVIRVERRTWESMSGA